MFPKAKAGLSAEEEVKKRERSPGVS